MRYFRAHSFWLLLQVDFVLVASRILINCFDASSNAHRHHGPSCQPSINLPYFNCFMQNHTIYSLSFGCTIRQWNWFVSLASSMWFPVIQKINIYPSNNIFYQQLVTHRFSPKTNTNNFCVGPHTCGASANKRKKTYEENRHRRWPRKMTSHRAHVNPSTRSIRFSVTCSTVLNRAQLRS